MKAVDLIKQGLEGSKGWAFGLLMDMKDSPLTQPTSKGGNHPLWVLGHLTHSESTLLDEFIRGKPNRFPEWKEVFGMGTQPTTNASDYPKFDDVLQKFEEVRAATLAHLATLDDSDLDNASHAPAEIGAGFSTVAGCFMAMCQHVTFHAGQVADARRAAGKDPLMA